MRPLSIATMAALCTLVTACGNPHSSTDVDAMAPGPDGAMQADGAQAGPDGIAAARAASDGAGLSLAIRGVTITYLKPQIGSTTSDPAGFTIQAAKLGPGLFVSVDPATLDPPATAGDVVDFTITKKGTVFGQPRAQAITSYARRATGANVGALAQDISAATDILTAASSYDGELADPAGSAPKFKTSDYGELATPPTEQETQPQPAPKAEKGVYVLFRFKGS